jgi:hypothetical protein
MDLHSLFDSEVLQAAPDGWMLDSIVSCNVFQLRVGDSAVVFEEGR